MTSLIVTAIVLAIVLALLFVPIGIGAKYEKNAFVIVKIAVLSFEIPIEKLLKKRSKKPKNTKEEKDKKTEDELNKSIVGLDFMLSLLGDFRHFVRKRITLEDFSLNITFGTADAASTAVYTGHLWSLSFNLLALIDKLICVDNPKVEINPVFDNATFSVVARGIIKTCLAHIIATAIVFAYKFLKYKRNKIRRNTK